MANEPGNWIKVPQIPYLYQKDGGYYVRRRIAGRTLARSLRTTSLSVARVRTPVVLLELLQGRGGADDEGQLMVPSRHVARRRARSAAPGQMTLRQARDIYQTRVNAGHTNSPKTKARLVQASRLLLESWKDSGEFTLGTLTRDVVESWAAAFAGRYSPVYFNSMLTVLRNLLDILIENAPPLPGGGVVENVARKVKPLGVRSEVPELPSPSDWVKVLAWLDEHRPRAAWAVRLIGYTGCRISEARALRWSDLDLPGSRIRVANAKRRTTSSAPRYRWVPLIPDAREFFSRLQEATRPSPEDRMMPPTSTLDDQLTFACRAVGCVRLKPHTLRHLFATRCIEAGVDVPTVSRWLGHLDGGGLALKVYGHLRDEHSIRAAAKIPTAEQHKTQTQISNYYDTKRQRPTYSERTLRVGGALHTGVEGSGLPRANHRGRSQDIHGRGGCPTPDQGASALPGGVSDVRGVHADQVGHDQNSRESVGGSGGDGQAAGPAGSDAPERGPSASPDESAARAAAGGVEEGGCGRGGREDHGGGSGCSGAGDARRGDSGDLEKSGATDPVCEHSPAAPRPEGVGEGRGD